MVRARRVTASAKYRDAPMPPRRAKDPILRAAMPLSGSEGRTTIRAVPVYEFLCVKCGHHFEELVGPHVETKMADVVCPECGAENPNRLAPSSVATGRGLTPGQKRRLEAQRDIHGGGAKQRFKESRAKEKRAATRRAGRRGNR
jgi:putative FmdB family regulatory protein